VAVVLDTDIVSYLYKRDTRAELYRQHLNDPPFIISFMSLAELRRWTLGRNWGDRRRQELEKYLSRYLVIHPEGQRSLWRKQSIRVAICRFNTRLCFKIPRQTGTLILEWFFRNINIGLKWS
jgi:hypothetical protein